MQIINGHQISREQPTPHGRIGMSTVSRLTADVPARRMEFLRRALHPGAAIGKHVIDHDEVYYVIAGRGEVEADGQRQILGAGDMAYLYAGEEVGIRQLGDEPLDLVVSWPLAVPTGN